jgi:Nucleotidyltransferase domain.
MPISLRQLEGWANQGAVTISSNAYNSIRTALLATNSPLRDKSLDIFLQGSYANATNIRGDSDIDVVVLYDNTFHKDMTALTPEQQRLHEIVFPPATYPWHSLHGDVLAALRLYFGNSAVTPGHKSIKVQTSHGGMTADVVPAVQFRRYATFVNQNNLTAHWGIQFFDSSNNPIVNYPKYHKDNGEAKNHATRTRGQYKPTVRLFKNFRNYLVDNGLLGNDVVPSYFVECALHNAPDNLFIGDYTNTVPAILHYLLNTPYAGFLCQNGVVPLIGSGSTQWNVNNFVTFLTVANNKWNNGI